MKCTGGRPIPVSKEIQRVHGASGAGVPVGPQARRRYPAGRSPSQPEAWMKIVLKVLTGSPQPFRELSWSHVGWKHRERLRVRTRGNQHWGYLENKQPSALAEEDLWEIGNWEKRAGWSQGSRAADFTLCPPAAARGHCTSRAEEGIDGDSRLSPKSE